MRQKIKRVVNRVFARMGFKMQFVPRPGWVKQNYSDTPGGALEIGSNGSPKEGYWGCDIRSGGITHLVCPAWHVDRYCSELKHIYTRHTFEHLTDQESRWALKACFCALAVGGEIEIIVPDLDFHIQQWQKANWEHEEMDKFSDAKWGHAGLFGWQRECDPSLPEYNNTYWDVHKTGYNAERIRYLLRMAGFSRIQTQIVDEVHLVAKAVKTVQHDERQVSGYLSGIRNDHKARYSWAISMLESDVSNISHVADIACGIGYGTNMLAEAYPSLTVYGVDVDEATIGYAREYYLRNNNEFICQDAAQVSIAAPVDVITCFETLEHLSNADILLSHFHSILKPSGVLFLSTPNEDEWPLKKVKNPYHYRHYSVKDLVDVLSRNGFRVDLISGQNAEGVISDSKDCRYLLARCTKV